jgi:2-amino-4-hydroxy-6-hydroxymethyldihydropteridine diphosphokinase
MKRMESFSAILGLGSNIGDKRNYLTEAKYLIAAKAGVILKESSIYASPPWGDVDQDEFLNQVIEIETVHPPLQLLYVLQDIERQLGKKKIRNWGPRIIDIDILFYGTFKVDEPGLKIPHPQWKNRRFVLEPLKEILPDFVDFETQKNISTLIEETTDQGKLKVQTY